MAELVQRFNKDDQDVLTSLWRLIFDDNLDDASLITVSNFHSMDKSILEIDTNFLGSS